jgi:hypothetical protein
MLDITLSYHQYPSIAEANLRILLLNVCLGASLHCLSLVMLILSLQLSFTITSDTSDSTADGALCTVRDAGAEVIELALGFLGC